MDDLQDQQEKVDNILHRVDGEDKPIKVGWTIKCNPEDVVINIFKKIKQWFGG